MIHEQAPDVFRLLLSSGGGDVRIARACAEALLSELGEPPSRLGDARLLLTAACLHLYPVAGPDPTLADLHAFLVSLGRPEARAWKAMAASPLGLVQYVAEEFKGESARSGSAALSLAIRAVEAKTHAWSISGT